MCTLHFVIILLLREFMRGIKLLLSIALIRNGLEEKFILHEHYSHKRVQTFSHRAKYQDDQQMLPLQQIQQTPFHVNRWDYKKNQMFSFFGCKVAKVMNVHSSNRIGMRILVIMYKHKYGANCIKTTTSCLLEAVWVTVCWFKFLEKADKMYTLADILHTSKHVTT